MWGGVCGSREGEAGAANSSSGACPVCEEEPDGRRASRGQGHQRALCLGTGSPLPSPLGPPSLAQHGGPPTTPLAVCTLGLNSVPQNSHPPRTSDVTYLEIRSLLTHIAKIRSQWNRDWHSHRRDTHREIPRRGRVELGAEAGGRGCEPGTPGAQSRRSGQGPSLQPLGKPAQPHLDFRLPASRLRQSVPTVTTPWFQLPQDTPHQPCRPQHQALSPNTSSGWEPIITSLERPDSDLPLEAPWCQVPALGVGSCQARHPTPTPRPRPAWLGLLCAGD